MMQSRRWAAWLAAFLLAASLVVLPREGAAWTPYIDLTNPPVVDEGEPDGPPALVFDRPLQWRLVIAIQEWRLMIIVKREIPSDARVTGQTKVRSLRPR